MIDDKKRDWAKIPVGLPFTEMVTRSKNFTVTKLATESVDARETWMVPRQYEKKGYAMTDKEVVVTETVMREFDEEIEETVLESEEVEMEVTSMDEIEEEWPINKDAEEMVITSEVSLEPVDSVVPEISSKMVRASPLLTPLPTLPRWCCSVLCYACPVPAVSCVQPALWLFSSESSAHQSRLVCLQSSAALHAALWWSPCLAARAFSQKPLHAGRASCRKRGSAEGK